MARAGFYGLRTEWWHFCAGDWSEYSTVAEITNGAKMPLPTPANPKVASDLHFPPPTLDSPPGHPKRSGK